MHEASFLTNTTFWYGLAVLTFVFGLVFGGRKAIVGMIDAAIAKVVAELAEAKRLRAEAAATLESYKAKQAEAMTEAEAIVTKAKADAARLREEAKAELQAALARQEHLAMERIRMVQEEAVDEVRTFVIEEAMHELRGKLAKHAATPESGKIVDKIIADLPKLIAKHKVA